MARSLARSLAEREGVSEEARSRSASPPLSLAIPRGGERHSSGAPNRARERERDCAYQRERLRSLARALREDVALHASSSLSSLCGEAERRAREGGREGEVVGPTTNANALPGRISFNNIENDSRVKKKGTLAFCSGGRERE